MSATIQVKGFMKVVSRKYLESLGQVKSVIQLVVIAQRSLQAPRTEVQRVCFVQKQFCSCFCHDGGPQS
jgi:hypothetical protein